MLKCYFQILFVAFAMSHSVTSQQANNLANYNGNLQGDESVKEELSLAGGVDFSNCEPQVGR